MQQSIYAADKNVSGYADAEENEDLKRIRRLAYLLDNSILIPGINYRIGVDAIIGLIPGVGDTIGGAISSYIVYEAHRLGVPKRILLRMAYNVGVETLVGAIPIIGDLFDAAWKANTKNIALLDEYLSSQEARRSKNRPTSNRV